MMRSACLFLLSFCVSTMSYAYIQSGTILNLEDGRQIILFGDKYAGVSQSWNDQSVPIILDGLKNLALKYPASKIDFSFQDPSVYGAGKNLKKVLTDLRSELQGLPDNSFAILFPLMVRKNPALYMQELLENPAFQPSSATLEFHVMNFIKPPKFSSFLLGALAKGLAQDPGPWPKNLTARSNDPRGHLRLAFIKDKNWLRKLGASVAMKNLLVASQKLHAKMKFALDPELPDSVKIGLENYFNEFLADENSHLEAFANFASLKSGQEISVEDLNQSVAELADKIPIDVLYQFLSEERKMSDMCPEGPVIDILLTLFAKNHPDKMIAIVGHKMVEKVGRRLSNLGVGIESQIHIADPNLFLGALSKDPSILDNPTIIPQS
jgi:hypothetical protein